MQTGISVAKNKAVRFIQYRPRTENEVRRKLSGSGYDGNTIDRVVTQLKEENMLNDADFARAWAEERFLSKRLGWSRIRRELARKGVDRETVNRIMEELSDQYDETENAIAYLAMKYRGRPGPRDERKDIEALIRAGYNGNAARAAARQLKEKRPS